MNVAAIPRQQLAAARHAGATFEQAWSGALAVALDATTNSIERRRWTVALTETLPAWRDAYDARPAGPLALALDSLRELAA